MAKAPRPGRAKTRLCPPLRPAQAAALSAAFLRDITENIALAARTAPIAWLHRLCAGRRRGACSTDISPMAPASCSADGSPPMPPDVQGFGRCLLHAAQALFAIGLRRGLPGELRQPDVADRSDWSQAARALLAPGERIVLGPGGRRRLLPVGHETTARAPVRRHRVEHERCRCSDAGKGGGARPRGASRCPRGTTWMTRLRWHRLAAGADGGYARAGDHAHGIERNGRAGA